MAENDTAAENALAYTWPALDSNPVVMTQYL